MKKMFYFIKMYIFLALIIATYSVNKKNLANEQTLANSNKSCKEIEECKRCSVKEIKTQEECTTTGYRKRFLCVNGDNEQNYIIESCDENKKINPVYIFLVINIIIFICAYQYQKKQKNSIIKNVMVKLSIFKK